MNPTVVAVALSGGVDSLVAAYLLKKQGHALFGLHFITGYESGDHLSGSEKQGAAENATGQAADIRRRMEGISRQLQIEVYIVDCSREFRRQVVDYFTRAYAAGKTPSPCLVCNPGIKFGVLLEHARRRGAAYLATGHYARLDCGEDHRLHLYRGRDGAKDQSYFLARLSQHQLAKALFPLGQMTKTEVRALARQRGLHPLTGAESQDICFIRGRRYVNFMARQGQQPPKGTIETVDGRVIGTHTGIHGFTVGQRRGINCPAPEPYYVVKIDPMGNRLVVGGRKDLFSSSCRVTDISWIAAAPCRPLRCKVKIRYRQRSTACLLKPQGVRQAVVRFESPQSAVTPGQGAVFYSGDEVLGGGWIEPARDC